MFPEGVPLTKRIFDLTLTGLGLVIISPILLLLSLAVRLVHGSPVLFTQIRPGRFGKPFKIYKLRTMTNRRDAQGSLLPDSERITRLGHFLRASSLDELPELFNVLRGEMSLVGPRPLLMQYLTRYTPEQARRHAVLPGITGWAQVNGRNALTWFRRAYEPELRAQLAASAPGAAAGAGAHEALAAVRDGARRLPLRRSVDVDLVSVVTEHAVERFFVALAEEPKRVAEEREAARGGYGDPRNAGPLTGPEEKGGSR